MTYTSTYASPLGSILLASDEIGLCGLWFEGQKYYARSLPEKREEAKTPAIAMAKKWLDQYFSGKEPGFMPPIHLIGTDFQKEVWELLMKIPYGQTATYNDIAKAIAQKRGIAKMSARAVGSAVGQNRISVILPCHRVIGANGSLTGYAGGIERKIRLLEIEGIQSSGKTILRG